MVLLGRDVAAAWASLDPANLAATLPQFKLTMSGLVHHYGQASVTLAGQYYRAQRQAAGVTSSVTLRPASQAPLDQISASLSWAVKDVWQSQDADVLTSAQTKVTGVAEKLALDPGRWTAIDSVAGDRQATGWARVPEPGCCSFCALLATRGAVYKEKSGATNTRGPRNPNAGKPFIGEGKAKFHDHCRCHVEPVFFSYEPSAQIREWDALYAQASRGKSGRAARNAFRQAFEGRTVT